MNLSPLQLDHYVFSEISIRHIPNSEPDFINGYPSMAHANFSSEVEFNITAAEEIPEDGIQRYGVQLIIIVEPKDLEKPNFPYHIRVGVVGIFHGPKLPEDKREALVVVNGASVLYGAIREQLMTLSARSTGPTLMLPVVRFDQLGDEYMAKKNAEKSAAEKQPEKTPDAG